MTATSREIAEKLANQIESYAWDDDFKFSQKTVPLITAALEEREREGYERGISDAAKFIAYYIDNEDVAASCEKRLQALAQKDVKP